MPHQTLQVPCKTILSKIFRSAGNNDSLNFDEVEEALSHGVWEHLDPKTVQLLLRTFNINKLKSVNFDNFIIIWTNLTNLYNCYQSLDRDHNGHIDRAELKIALYKSGFIFSEEVINLLMKKYDRSERGTIHFNSFIQCFINLQKLITAFQELDADLDGWTEISYNTFLDLAFKSV